MGSFDKVKWKERGDTGLRERLLENDEFREDFEKNAKPPAIKMSKFNPWAVDKSVAAVKKIREHVNNKPINLAEGFRSKSAQEAAYRKDLEESRKKEAELSNKERSSMRLKRKIPREEFVKAVRETGNAAEALHDSKRWKEYEL